MKPSSKHRTRGALMLSLLKTSSNNESATVAEDPPYSIDFEGHPENSREPRSDGNGGTLLPEGCDRVSLSPHVQTELDATKQSDDEPFPQRLEMEDALPEPRSDDLLQIASDFLASIAGTNQMRDLEEADDMQQQNFEEPPISLSENKETSSSEGRDHVSLSPHVRTELDATKQSDDEPSPQSLEMEDASDEEGHLERMETEDHSATDERDRDHSSRSISQTTKAQKSKQKMKRLMGKPYVGIKRIKEDKLWVKVPRPAKTMKPACNCQASGKYKKFCCDQFDEETRNTLFKQYWKMKDWNEKRTFVAAMIDVAVPKDLKNRMEEERSRRAKSLFFYLKKNNQRLRVCKKMFLNTLAISDWFAQSCTKNTEESDECDTQNSDDNEEVAAAPRINPKARVTPQIAAKMSGLREFLKSLPNMESHYCRKETKKLYLEPIFQSKSEVYEFYAQETKKSGQEVVALQTFCREFDSMNLSIYKPRKDQCDTCVGFKTGNVPKEIYDDHQRRKELARNEMNNDSENENAGVFTMDMEGVLMSPRLMASAQYYKMKLCVHNFTIFDNITKKVMCYVWHEGEGGVTSNEFATIITTFIEEQHRLRPEKNVIILWSDGCGYQNRNVNLANALAHNSEKLGLTIIQKYLERGHTQMKCDSIHSRIEKRLKNKLVYTPAGYLEIIESARKTPEPYEVKYLDHTFFKDFSKIGRLSSIRPGYKTGDPTVTDISALKYVPSGELFYKLRFDEDWVLFERRSKQKNQTSSCGSTIPQLYPSSLKIKPDKYNHLQQLKQSIPADFHRFYDDLQH